MARPLSKTLTTTRVEYKTVEVVDGVPQFVDRPDAVFSGILEKERAVGRDSGVFLREGKSEADLKRFRGWLPLKALIAFVSSDAKAVLGIYENERRKT